MRGPGDAKDPEAALRTLFLANPHPMFLYDPATLRFLDVNDAAAAKYGWSRDEFRSLTLADIRRPEDVAALLADIASQPEGLRRTTTHTHKTRDGTLLDVEILAHTVEWEGKSAVLAVAQDVTDRRRAERDLRESEARWRSLIAHAPESIALLDREGVVRLSNRRAELVGSRATLLVPPGPAADELAALLDIVLREGRAVSAELPFVQADGSQRLCLASAGPIRQDDQIAGAVLLASDVSQRRRDEDALREADKLSALGTLVAGVAHEINNPLAFMRGNVELTQLVLEDALARRDLPDDLRATLCEAAEHQAVALKGIEQATNITQSLRRVSRRGAAQRGVEDLNVLAESVVTVATPRLGEKQTIEADLFATRLVRVSQGEISQILLNLIFNAIDATSTLMDGRIVVRTADEGTDGVALEIEDNGPGILPEARARLFTPFFTTKPQGTGLGLSISRRIARDHGGDLTFSTSEGRTVFRLRLPAAPETSALPQRAGSPSVQPGAPARTSHP